VSSKAKHISNIRLRALLDLVRMRKPLTSRLLEWHQACGGDVTDDERKLLIEAVDATIATASAARRRVQKLMVRLRDRSAIPRSVPKLAAMAHVSVTPLLDNISEKLFAHAKEDLGRILRRIELGKILMGSRRPRSNTDSESIAVLLALIRLSRTLCRSQRPSCDVCPIRGSCGSRRTSATRPVTAVDLFSGAGGLSLGFSGAGIRPVYAFESDLRAAATYEANFNRTPVVRTPLQVDQVQRLCSMIGLRRGMIDVILAGPPCQGYSISNLRTRNASNPHNQAWKIVLKFAEILRPQAIVIENVGGILTYSGGRIIREIERRISGLGYKVQRYALNAVDFGVPQMRRRVFLLGLRSGKPPKCIPRLTTEPVTVGAALRDLPKVGNGNEIEELRYRFGGGKLNAFQRRMRTRSGATAFNCITTLNTPLIVRRFAAVKPGCNWQSIPRGLFQTYSNAENCHRWLYRRLPDNKPSVTISNFRKNMLIHPWSNRTLTVREAARLQAIPDGFVFYGNLQAQQQQVANAVPPPLGSAIARRLLPHLR
jgi:DNA (cytosine-5)-methyltransferase 1